jgi:hypothetical protein
MANALPPTSSMALYCTASSFSSFCGFGWLLLNFFVYQLVVLLPFLLVIVEYLLEWLLLIASVQLVMYA